MICEIQSSGTIEQYFYGELATERRAELQAHVRACPDCRQALEDLSIIRAALAARPEVAAPPAGWSRFMARLESAIQEERQAPGHVTGDRALRPPAVLTRRLVPYLAMAALLAVITASVLLVIRQRGDEASVRPPSPGTPAVASEIDSPPARDPGLLALSDQHFERSKLVVLGLATKDASNADDSWQYERQLASTLLGDTRLYRRAAEQRGMDTLAGVMRDLELVLLQTSMSDAPDAESLGQLQRLIRRRDLLTKMNAVYTQP
jgi:hypothetical protein